MENAVPWKRSVPKFAAVDVKRSQKVIGLSTHSLL